MAVAPSTTPGFQLPLLRLWLWPSQCADQSRHCLGIPPSGNDLGVTGPPFSWVNDSQKWDSSPPESSLSDLEIRPHKYYFLQALHAGYTWRMPGGSHPTCHIESVCLVTSAPTFLAYSKSVCSLSLHNPVMVPKPKGCLTALEPWTENPASM